MNIPLQTSDDYFRAALAHFENSSESIAVLDEESRFLAFSGPYREAFERLFGRSIEPGDRISEALDHLPEEQESVLYLLRRARLGEEVTVVRGAFATGSENASHEFV